MEDLSLVAPVSGPIVPLAETPDPVFAGGMMGDGLAIDPTSDTLVAPCAGTVCLVHRAGHAVTLKADAGAEILMHIGIDTVTLDGRGFVPEVKAGQRVRAGDRLIRFEPDAVARAARSLQTIVAVVNGEKFAVTWRAAGMARVGESRLMVVRAKGDGVKGGGAEGGAAESVEAKRGAANRGAADRGAADRGGTKGGPPGAAPAAAERIQRATIGHHGGLHARPAALVREAAGPYDADAVVRYGEHEASVHSVISLMALGVDRGEEVEVRASGRQARALLAAVVYALESETDGQADQAADQRRRRGERERGGRGDDAGEVGSAGSRAPGEPEGALGGVCAAPGLAVGRVVRLDQATAEVVEAGESPQRERTRLSAALAEIHRELADAVRTATARGAAAERDIFSAHLALLEDPEILGAAERAVAGGKSAGFAYRTAVRGLCQMLTRTGSALLAERAADLRDIERRVLGALAGEDEPGAGGAGPALFDDSILVADDIGPSELTRLPAARLAGLATARGGPTSHVAILARALGIPAVVAIGAEVLSVPHGQEVLLDAGAEAAWLDPAPTPTRRDAARTEVARHAAHRAAAAAAASTAATTLDGHQIEVAANIATDADAREAVRHGADAVGLLRTELLFLDRHVLPDEGEQRAAYQAVVDALGGRTAVIRTLDVGNDKELPALPLPDEANPALGMRGIRMGLSRPDVLDTQLRALLGVRPASACRVMLPMIADAGELAAVRARLDQLADDVGLAAGERPELGVMIEVPSAALLAGQLAREADFLSIGTNDLTQYALAMDRTHPGLAARLDGLHPAVLELVRLTVAGGHAHGRWVGVCGALASDLTAVPVLVGLGVDELSVAPGAVPEVKARVRELDRGQCEREVERFLAMSSAGEVRAAARTRWP